MTKNLINIKNIIKDLKNRIHTKTTLNIIKISKNYIKFKINIQIRPISKIC